MEPPSRPSSLRRTASSNFRSVSPQQSDLIAASRRPDFERGSSPIPYSITTRSEVKPDPDYMISHDISSRSWANSENNVARRTTSLQIELAECIETKTVTTTTTTKRTYPPLLVRPPSSLQSLDTKEYPLALKPTPRELANFSYEVDGKTVQFQENESLSSLNQVAPQQREATPRSTKHTRVLATDRPYRTPENAKSENLNRDSELSTEDSWTTRVSQNPINTARSSDSLTRLPATNTPISHARRREHSRRVNSLSSHPIPTAAAIQTPDLNELDPISNNNRSSLSFVTSASDSSPDEFNGHSSPSLTAAHNSFPTTVATPPIADSDLETFDELSQVLTHASESLPRPTINTAGIQNASLPSPSLSPTFAAANLRNSLQAVADEQDAESGPLTMFPQLSDSHDSQEKLDRRLQRMVDVPSEFRRPTVMDTRSMLDTFDSMPSDMKSFMMYQFLRRCPRKTLHVIADVVNPALQCDFLQELPAELSLQILGFLDYKDMCCAAQVSKRWRDIIDSNETGWKELFDRDGFELPEGELERAIREGWGWQDPSGPDGWERDLSNRPTSSDAETAMSSNAVSTALHVARARPRLGKRKRIAEAAGSDRSKRQAASQEFSEKLRSKGHKKAKRSEGPVAASTAAALAVPNPNFGLPTLRKLHLFKSLYRRHHMLQRNWMTTEIKPHHFAFPAHPRHVITCLQFDDDKILTGSDDTFIHVYDTRTGKLRKRLEGHEGGVWALQYEGNVLVSGSTDRSVRVWDIEKGLCTQVFYGHTSTVRCLQILMPVSTGKTYKDKPIMIPEKPLIITGSRDSQLRVWRLPELNAKRYIQTGPLVNDADCPFFVRVLSGHGHSVRAISAYQDTLVSGSYDSSVRVWKISTGETLHTLRGHSSKVYSVVLDHQRNRCISGSMDNSVKIWSLETGICLHTLDGHTSLVGLLDLQDNRLVSAAADSTLRIWDPENGQCKSTLTAHTGAITCFQHDSMKVISGSDRTLKMWNVKTGECLKDLLTDLSGVWQVKFDERRCVAAVQRDALTYVEVLDFGASRDGIPSNERGRRILLPPSDADRIVDDDDFQA